MVILIHARLPGKGRRMEEEPGRPGEEVGGVDLRPIQLHSPVNWTGPP